MRTARASSTIRRSRRTWTWSGCRAGSSPQRDDAVAGAGGVQRAAAVRPRGVARAAAAAVGGSGTAGQEDFPPAVAERDSRLDVLVGEVDAAREPLATVVLAEQSVGSDVASVVCTLLRIADHQERIGCSWKDWVWEASWGWLR